MDATAQKLGASAISSLRGKLPPRLARHTSLTRLRESSAADTVPLDEGGEILLSIDALLGDGTGKLLESIGLDLASRVLSQGGGVARPGDLRGTVARLQAFLEHPFLGVPLLFELRRTPTGFVLVVGVTGNSRATRALRHLTIGAILAAERFARDVGAESLQISAENAADRSNITACYLRQGAACVEEPPPSRRPPASRPSTATSLSAEVARILRSSPPARQIGEEESQPAQSMTMRSSDSAMRGPAIK